MLNFAMLTKAKEINRKNMSSMSKKEEEHTLSEHELPKLNIRELAREFSVLLGNGTTIEKVLSQKEK